MAKMTRVINMVIGDEDFDGLKEMVSRYNYLYKPQRLVTMAEYVRMLIRKDMEENRSRDGDEN